MSDVVPRAVLRYLKSSTALTRGIVGGTVFAGMAFATAVAVQGARGPAEMPPADAVVQRAAPVPEFDPFAVLCRAATAPGIGIGLLRLAQATEVSPAAREAARPAPDYADTDPPLYDGLGTIGYRITTANADAQRYFDQGLRLAYGFNHLEAQRAFRKAQKLDPGCAMCFWGEALVLGPNINLPMMPEAVAPAYAAAAKARSLAAPAGPREQALIEALAARYAEDPKADRPTLDRAYAAAMARVAERFSDDTEILTLYAESVMDVSPWDYWEPGGAAPHPHSAPIVPTLERVLARDPAHVGAIHLYIHAVEASDRPERAEPYADRLRGAVPGAGHLVHMPSHIYFRLGRYLDALHDNKIAAAVDEKYLAESKVPSGVYSLGYYPHNVHFVIATAQMSGDGPTVLAAAEKLRGLIPDEIAKDIALLQPIKAAPYFAHATFGAPDAVLALPDPGDVPYVKAMWRYARGVAQVKRGDLAAASIEARELAALEDADFAVMNAAGVPAKDVVALARHVVEGRVAQARGDRAAAIAAFARAATIQDRLPYMEPPYWYYPVRQSLAAALLQAGELDKAEEQFFLALRRAPNSGWATFGLAEIARARGDAEEARRLDGDLAKMWIGDRALLTLSAL
jgi:tetratricopeptide (TPR) repeat protein